VRCSSETKEWLVNSDFVVLAVPSESMDQMLEAGPRKAQTFALKLPFVSWIDASRSLQPKEMIRRAVLRPAREQAHESLDSGLCSKL